MNSTTTPEELSPEGRAGAPDTEEIAEARHLHHQGSKAKYLLRRALLPFYKPTRSRVFPGPLKAMLAQPAIFELWYRARALKGMLTHGMQALDDKGMKAGGGFLHKVASYNKSQLWEWHRIRTEKLTMALRCIDDLPANPRILVIGPRNEAEVLLLNLYRFPMKDIEAIDIFSYSKIIKLQDMHDIKFPDNSFDVVYSAWTLRYSYDLQKAVDEIVRVLKPGGLAAIGWSHESIVTSADGSPMKGGLSDLHRAFGDRLGWIYWQEVLDAPAQGSKEISTIFRVEKPVKTNGKAAS